MTERAAEPLVSVRNLSVAFTGNERSGPPRQRGGEGHPPPPGVGGIGE